MEELASGLELHEARRYMIQLCTVRLLTLLYGKFSGITKSLIFEENTPALNLTFVIICNLRDEIINEDVTDDDLVQMGTLVLI